MKPIITVFNGPYPTVSEELEARLSEMNRKASKAMKARDLDAYLNAKNEIRRLQRQRDYDTLFGPPFRVATR